MVNHLEFFEEIEIRKKEIELADGTVIEALGTGTIRLEFKNVILKLSNTLFIENLSTNLISMSTFPKTKHVIFSLKEEDAEVIDQNVKLHKTSAYPSPEYFKKIYSEKQIPTLECVTCSTCKMTKTPFKGTFPEATRKLQYLHIDLCGPISPPILEVGTGNVKITHHVKFLQNLFPAKKGDNIDSDKHFLTLVPNETDTVSRNTDPDHRNSTTIHNTLDAPIGEPVILSPTLDQIEPDLPLSTAQDLLVATPSVPVHKGYSWIPEHEINSPQEIFGNLGD
ncbi:hypothetical protein O181_076756 [Austropuccinia psidii MF-1]|uniref:Retrovirus-related Pol polyprotein from transposon TNT 1-94-like beta-barrel domain-containing protein n=1 Tax=Austropuccinia psidii MF-1 TaxID=1389203 RepID=A0A9Q3IBG2_9BASI|nr:hypothetical protein [Austropuccinia psidii MF-1]